MLQAPPRAQNPEHGEVGAVQGKGGESQRHSSRSLLQCLVSHIGPGPAPQLRLPFSKREGDGGPGRCSHPWRGGGFTGLRCPPPRSRSPHLPHPPVHLFDFQSLQVRAGPGMCSKEPPGLCPLAQPAGAPVGFPPAVSGTGGGLEGQQLPRCCACRRKATKRILETHRGF